MDYLQGRNGLSSGKKWIIFREEMDYLQGRNGLSSGKKWKLLHLRGWIMTSRLLRLFSALCPPAHSPTVGLVTTALKVWNTRLHMRLRLWNTMLHIKLRLWNTMLHIKLRLWNTMLHIKLRVWNTMLRMTAFSYSGLGHHSTQGLKHNAILMTARSGQLRVWKNVRN